MLIGSVSTGFMAERPYVGAGVAVGCSEARAAFAAFAGGAAGFVSERPASRSPPHADDRGPERRLREVAIPQPESPVSHEVIVDLIGSTKTTTALKVRSKLDKRQYVGGITLSDKHSRSSARTFTANGTTPSSPDMSSGSLVRSHLEPPEARCHRSAWQRRDRDRGHGVGGSFLVDSCLSRCRPQVSADSTCNKPETDEDSAQIPGVGEIVVDWIHQSTDDDGPTSRDGE